VHLIEFVRLYTGVFSEDTPELGPILHAWLQRHVASFLTTLESSLATVTEGASILLLLDSSMSFGQIMSRIQVDFRVLLPPIFEARIQQLFTQGLASSCLQFREAMKAFRWSNHVLSVAPPPSTGSSAPANSLSPSHELLEFPFLAVFTNACLNQLNQLRQCAPLSLEAPLGARLEQELLSVVAGARELRSEGLVITAQQESALLRFLKLLQEVLLPHLGRCFDRIFGAVPGAPPRPQSLQQRLTPAFLPTPTTHVAAVPASAVDLPAAKPLLQNGSNGS
jgi:hypothetical protein